jgi:hypothetical protein
MDSGTLDLFYIIGPVENPLQVIYDQPMSTVVWDLAAGTISVSSYDCAEGTLGVTLFAFFCAGTSFGPDNLNDTTVDYATVPGTRIVGNDDVVELDQQQAADYAGVLSSWDGDTLVVDSHAWAASGGTTGNQMIFDVVEPPPVGQQFVVLLEEVRLGDPAGVIFGTPSGTLYGYYDDGPDTVSMNPGGFSITFNQGGNELFTHWLWYSSFDLANGTVDMSWITCSEGPHAAIAQQSFCGNYSWGADGVDDSSLDYSTIPATRSIRDDDVALGPMRQATDYGAFLHWALPTQLTAKSADWTLNETSTWVSTAGTLLIFDTQPPPDVTITKPADGSTWGTHEAPLEFFASAIDSIDGDLSDQVTWHSDIDGAFANPAHLSAGSHTITASITTSSAITREDSVQILIVNVPVLTIDSPEDGAVFLAGETIQLSGTAIDADDGDVSDDIQWLMGDLGNFTGASQAIAAVPGVYDIEARSHDAGSSEYAVANVQILVYRDDDADSMADNWEAQFGIDDPNADADGDGVTNIQEFQTGTSPVDVAPVVSVLSPENGGFAGIGETIDFNASATDTEDGDLSFAIQWMSDRDGPLGSGTSLATQLSLGNHVITVTVQDSQGQSPIITAMVSIGVGVIIPGDGDINDDSNVDVSDLLMLEQAVIDRIDLE